MAHARHSLMHAGAGQYHTFASSVYLKQCLHDTTIVGDDPWHFTELHLLCSLGFVCSSIVRTLADPSLWVAVGAQDSFALDCLPVPNPFEDFRGAHVVWW